MIVPYRIGFALPETSQDTFGAVSTTTEWINLNDNIQYENPSFGPAITMPQTSLLSINGPYQPVQQTVQLDVLGDTPSRCWENLNSLLRVLQQADRWKQSIPSNNVVRFFVQATVEAPMVFSDVLGFVSDSAPEVASEITTPLGPRYALHGVTISFVRFGTWERLTRAKLYQDPETSFRYPAPKPVLVDFTASDLQPGTLAQRDVYSRMAIRGRGNYSLQNNAFMAIASGLHKMKLVDSANFPVGVGTESTDTLTTNAYGGSFRRFSTGSTATIDIALDSSFTPKHRVGVFAKVRNNSTTRSAVFTLDTSNPYRNPNGQEWLVTVGPNTTGDALGEPRIVFLGTIDQDFELNETSSYERYLPGIKVAGSPMTGTDSIDIDYILCVALDDPWADSIIGLSGNPNMPDHSGSIGNDNIYANAGVDSVNGFADIQKRSYPLVIQADGNFDVSSARIGANYQGNAHIVCLNDRFAYAFMAEFRGEKVTNGSIYATVWQPEPNTAWWLHAYQSPAYLVPPGA